MERLPPLSASTMLLLVLVVLLLVMVEEEADTHPLAAAQLDVLPADTRDSSVSLTANMPPTTTGGKKKKNLNA